MPTGSNREAARLAGIDTRAVTFCGLYCRRRADRAGGAAERRRFNQIPSNAGLGLEMKVIAAVVVGGAAITGGRGTIAGTVLGVIAARRDRPGAHVPRRQRALGARRPGRIILAAVAIDADASRRDRRASTACGGSRQVDGKPPGSPARRSLALSCSPRSRCSRLIARAVLLGGQRRRGAALQRGARPARRRADADPHHRRHRSLGRLDDGAGGGRLRRRVARLGLPLPVAVAARADAPAPPAARSTRC